VNRIKLTPGAVEDLEANQGQCGVELDEAGKIERLKGGGDATSTCSRPVSARLWKSTRAAVSASLPGNCSRSN
jgi:hypothetical protein